MSGNNPISQSPTRGVIRDIINAQYHLYEHTDARLHALGHQIINMAADIAGDWLESQRRANQNITFELALAEVARRLSLYNIAYQEIQHVLELQDSLIRITLQFQNLNGELIRTRSERDRAVRELEQLRKKTASQRFRREE